MDGAILKAGITVDTKRALQSLKNFSAVAKQTTENATKTINVSASEIPAFGLEKSNVLTGLKGPNLFGRFFDQLESVENQINRQFIAPINAASGALVRFTQRVSLAGAALSVLGVKQAFDFEAAEMAFYSLSGSYQRATELVQQSKELALESPFQLKDFLAGSKILYAVGGEALSTRKLLEDLGDTSSSLGVAFEQAAVWTARLYNSLKSGSGTGTTGDDMMRAGLITAETLVWLQKNVKKVSFSELWGRVEKDLSRFNGSMKRMATTGLGSFAVLRGNISLAMADAFGGLAGVVRQAMQDVNEEIIAMVKGGELKAFSREIETFATRSIQSLLRLKTAYSELSAENKTALKNFAAFFAALLVSWKIGLLAPLTALVYNTVKVVAKGLNLLVASTAFRAVAGGFLANISGLLAYISSIITPFIRRIAASLFYAIPAGLSVFGGALKLLIATAYATLPALIAGLATLAATFTTIAGSIAAVLDVIGLSDRAIAEKERERYSDIARRWESGQSLSAEEFKFKTEFENSLSATEAAERDRKKYQDIIRRMESGNAITDEENQFKLSFESGAENQPQRFFEGWLEALDKFKAEFNGAFSGWKVDPLQFPDFQRQTEDDMQNVASLQDAMSNLNEATPDLNRKLNGESVAKNIEKIKMASAPLRGIFASLNLGGRKNNNFVPPDSGNWRPKIMSVSGLGVAPEKTKFKQENNMVERIIPFLKNIVDLTGEIGQTVSKKDTTAVWSD